MEYSFGKRSARNCARGQAGVIRSVHVLAGPNAGTPGPCYARCASVYTDDGPGTFSDGCPTCSRFVKGGAETIRVRLRRDGIGREQ